MVCIFSTCMVLHRINTIEIYKCKLCLSIKLFHVHGVLKAGFKGNSVVYFHYCKWSSRHTTYHGSIFVKSIFTLEFLLCIYMKAKHLYFSSIKNSSHTLYSNICMNFGPHINFFAILSAFNRNYVTNDHLSYIYMYYIVHFQKVFSSQRIIRQVIMTHINKLENIHCIYNLWKYRKFSCKFEWNNIKLWNNALQCTDEIY